MRPDGRLLLRIKGVQDESGDLVFHAVVAFSHGVPALSPES